MHQGLGIHHSTTVHWKLKAILKLRMFPLRLTFCNFQFYPLAKFKTSISILFLYSGPMDIWRGLLYFSEASFLKVETVPVIVNQGWFCLPRDTGPCLETFTIVAPGKGDGPGIQWAEAKEAAGYTGQPPAPQQRINWSTMSIVLKLRNPGREEVIFTNSRGSMSSACAVVCHYLLRVGATSSRNTLVYPIQMGEA